MPYERRMNPSKTPNVAPSRSPPPWPGMVLHWRGTHFRCLQVNYRDYHFEEGNFITVRVWNPTAANLMLMAQGSCAPEMLSLSSLGNNFFNGDLDFDYRWECSIQPFLH